MCIAIYKKPAGIITEETLKRCHEANPDGCGFAYVSTDNYGVSRVKVKHSLDFDKFLKQYRRATRTSPESPFIIHFRIKTHGKVDLKNCHPFVIKRDQVFIHNGVISGVGFDKDLSDTRLFNDKVLRLLPKNWEKNTGIALLVEDFIKTSKLVVLNVKGEVKILNERLGNWDGEVWYSNKSYQPPIPRGTVTYGKREMRNNYDYDNYNPDWYRNPRRAEDNVFPVNRGGKSLLYSHVSIKKCDGKGCTKYMVITLLAHYWSDGKLFSYCPHCLQKARDHHDPVEVVSYEFCIDYMNDWDLLSVNDIKPIEEPLVAKKISMYDDKLRIVKREEREDQEVAEDIMEMEEIMSSVYSHRRDEYFYF